mgnify:FL=1|jgi:hypothetical protein
MEIIVALGVPEGAPLFASLALVHLTSSTAISVWLVAVGTVIAEACVVRAVLPADWANTAVAVLAVRVAKSTIFLLVIRA